MREPNDPPARASLRLIGRFRLKIDGLDIELPSRRARGLLAYLALAPDRTASRERLCGLLWSDRGETQARASLRQCLLELRSAMAAAKLDLLEVGRESIGLRSDGAMIDVEAVSRSLRGGADTLVTTLNAIRAYRLLDDLEIGGVFGEWRGQSREQLDRAVATAVEAELRGLQDRGDWQATRTLAEAFLQRDPLDELAVAAAIRADIALGATSAAHRRFQALEAGLARELNVSPSNATREALTAPLLARAPAAAGSSVDATTPARSPAPLPDKPSIAVLPFKNLSGDPDQDYFADAITEDVVMALSRWRWFFVIANGSSRTYKGLDVTDDQFGHELGVRYVLRGSVRKAGSRIRINAQLIDIRDNAHIWSDRFDRDLVDLFDLQDEITQRIVTAIEPAMLNSEGVRSAAKVLQDYTALDCFYRGMWFLNRITKEGYTSAVTNFRESIAREPTLHLGYVGLSRILWGGAIFGWTPDPLTDLADASSAAHRAIELAPEDAAAFAASAGASLYMGDHASALTDARRALDINSNFALAAVRLGHVLVFAGKPDEAIEPIERGIKLSPADPQLGINYNLLGVAHYQCEQYQEAVECARTAMHHNREAQSFVLAASLAQLGFFAEASKVLPTSDPRTNAVDRPMAPRYANVRHLKHWREGIRLASSAPDRRSD